VQHSINNSNSFVDKKVFEFQIERKGVGFK